MQRWGGDLRVTVGQHLLQEGEQYVAMKEAESWELMELRQVVAEMRTALGVGPEIPPTQLADLLWALRGTEWARGLVQGEEADDQDEREREVAHAGEKQQHGRDDGEAA